MVYGFNKQPGGSLLGYSYLIAILVIKKKKFAKHFIIGRKKSQYFIINYICIDTFSVSSALCYCFTNLYIGVLR